MKHIKYLLFILLIPLNVFAYGVQLSCPSTINENETFKCTIYSPSSCNEITLKLDLPDGFILEKESPSSYFKSSSSGTDLSYKATGMIDRVLTIVTIKAPAEIKSSSITIGLKDVKYKYIEGDSEFTSAGDVSESINIKTTTTKAADNIVLTLDPNNGTEETQTLSCTPKNGSCEVSLNNINTPSKEGFVFNGWGKEKNCETGETEKYTISKNTTVYACYRDSIIKNAHLELIEIKDYPIDYNSQILDYTINVPKETEINDIKITVTPYSNDATAEITKPEVLSPGENIFAIAVTEKGETVTYTIHVIKESSPAPYLVDLYIEDYYLTNYNRDKLNYSIKINQGIDSLNIVPIPNSPYYKVDVVGNEKLKDGGQITITVTGDDEVQTIYTVKVTVKTVWEQFKAYFIALAVVIFMFTVYFVVRHIKIMNGEIPSKHPIIKKEKKPKEKKVKEPKKKKEKKERKPLFGRKKKDAVEEIPPAEEKIESLELTREVETIDQL